MSINPGCELPSRQSKEGNKLGQHALPARQDSMGGHKRGTSQWSGALRGAVHSWAQPAETTLASKAAHLQGVGGQLCGLPGACLALVGALDPPGRQCGGTMTMMGNIYTPCLHGCWDHLAGGCGVLANTWPFHEHCVSALTGTGLGDPDAVPARPGPWRSAGLSWAHARATDTWQ